MNRQILTYFRKAHLLIRNSSSNIIKSKKMSTDYLPVLKYWFGEDLSQLKSDKYAGNNYVTPF